MKIKFHPLKLHELNILFQIVSKHQPKLLPLLDRLGVIPLKSEEREILRNILAMELSEQGLDENYEPNQWGLTVESLIDKLGEAVIAIHNRQTIRPPIYWL